MFIYIGILSTRYYYNDIVLEKIKKKSYITLKTHIGDIGDKKVVAGRKTQNSKDFWIQYRRLKGLAVYRNIN